MWCTKLETHRHGGSSTSVWTDDWVSMFSGGLGKMWYYSGVGLPSFPENHRSIHYESNAIFDTALVSNAPPVVCSFSKK